MTTTEPRNIIDISKQIIDIIPKNEIQIINEIENYIGSLWNQPPEVLKGSLCWSHFLSILNEQIPIISEDWQIKIKKIINNE
jgi:hypothetical protein